MLLILTIVCLWSGMSTFQFGTDCPSYCDCFYENSRLSLSCNSSQLNSMFRVPSPQLVSKIANTTSISCVYSHLRTFPINLCEFASTLTGVDFSYNSLVENLNPSHVGCLANLRTLNLSNNLISFVDANTFNSMLALQVLDLSHNRLTMIPTYLFYLKVPNLSHLFLSHNLLTEIDVWMLWMEKANLIDLSYNQIVSVVNRIGWNPFYLTSNVKMTDTSLIDLSYNRLRAFDDELLARFSVCSANDFKSFMDLFKQFRLSGNPIDCSCRSSYNTLLFYQSYAHQHLIPANFQTERLFSARCQAPQTFAGLSIFTFVNPAVCQKSSTPFSSANCGILATNKSSFLSKKLDHELFELETIAQITSAPSLINAQIAVLITGSIALLLLLLIILYCLCPIEIIALAFNLTPFLKSLCPCKCLRSSRKDLDHDHDLFISYNKSSERWVKSKLVPFIKNNCLVDKLTLHYGSENKSKEVFGPRVKEAMSRSSCTLMVLCNGFLANEWANLELRQHVQNLIGRNGMRLVCIQMHDVMDEQVEENFSTPMRLLRFVLLQNEEIMFWPKLAYFIFANQPNQPKVVAPKIHVKPQNNKVHSKSAKGADVSTTNEKNSSKIASGHFKTDTMTVFDVSHSYRASLPPLRVSKKLEETINERNKARTLLEGGARPKGGIRHSYHEEMSCSRVIEREFERRDSAASRKGTKVEEGSKDKAKKEGEKKVSKSNQSERIVSFDIYKLANNKNDESKILEKSDFV